MKLQVKRAVFRSRKSASPRTALALDTVSAILAARMRRRTNTARVRILKRAAKARLALIRAGISAEDIDATVQKMMVRI